MFESKKLAPLMQLVSIEAPALRSSFALHRQASEFRAVALRLRRTNQSFEIVAHQLIEAGAASLRQLSGLFYQSVINRKRDVHIHIIRVHVCSVQDGLQRG